MSSPSRTVARGNILVVDDNPDNLRLLSNMLTEQGYKARSATNGKMALKSVQSAPPDLILLDITMPGMNGYEVCQQLKADEQTRDIPVIFISALDEVLDKVQAFAVGGIDYITKPFQFEEVLARVKTHLTLYRLQQHEQQGEAHTAHANHFIPSDFLHLIQAEHIAPQQASALHQQPLTCLVIHMSPSPASRMPKATHDVFQALQAAALQIGTVIRQHHGFIDACYAQALVAYFPGRPNDALQAARALYQSSTEPLRIGIHMADTLLGIVDDGQRWHPVVLPDVRATAEYLAHLTQTYQTIILMSESVLGYLEDAEHAQGTRRDQVQIPGSPEPVTLFSIP